jgi:polyisoprenoid-binding protein YceI
MKRTSTALIAILALAAPALAAEYAIDPAHSEVTFEIRHLMSEVSGRFDEFDGEIVADFDNLEASSVAFTIQAASIDTRNADRDKHLRSEDFFDVANHPEITFSSTKIVSSGDNEYAVTGILTMHGVSKAVTLPVTFLGEMQDPWGNTKAGFEIETSLDRKDYGIVWNKALDAGSLLLGDEVEIEINLQTTKK